MIGIEVNRIPLPHWALAIKIKNSTKCTCQLPLETPDEKRHLGLLTQASSRRATRHDEV